jgi:hypothetical protein
MGEAQLNGVHVDTIKLDLTCRPPHKRAKHDPLAVAGGHKDTIVLRNDNGAQTQGARKYLTRSERASLEEGPAQRMALLPLLHNLVERIEAERQCNEHMDVTSKKRHRGPASTRL